MTTSMYYMENDDVTNYNSKTLNALRMGVTPDVGLEAIISGRKIERDEIDQLFITMDRDQCSMVKFIQGEYGSGKTFMLEYVKQEAIKRGYITAKLSVNGGFNMSKMDIFYLNIMSNLCISNENEEKGTDFDELFNQWIKELKQQKGSSEGTKEIRDVISKLSKYNSSFASVLLSYIRAKVSNDYEMVRIASSWIKGDQNISYELKKKLGVKGFVNKENAGDMLRGFMKLIQLIGYKGMIITIDEAELIMSNRADIRKNAYANIRYIMDMCGANEIENTCFMFAGTTELFENDIKGFKSYEALRQRIGDIVKDNRRIVNTARQPILYLRELDDNAYYEILEKVLEIHEAQYDYEAKVDRTVLYNLTKVECSKLLKGDRLTPRIFIKKLLDVLDLLESNPELPIFRTKVRSS